MLTKKIFAHGKIKRKEVHGEKEKKKPCLERKERVQFCQEKKKNSFVKATGIGRAPCWRPD